MDNTALLQKHTIQPLHIDAVNNEVRIRQTNNGVDHDFTMRAGEQKDLDEDTVLHFESVGHYTSAARDVDYARLGFDAPRHVRIQGEWNIKGNK